MATVQDYHHPRRRPLPKRPVRFTAELLITKIGKGIHRLNPSVIKKTTMVTTMTKFLGNLSECVNMFIVIVLTIALGAYLIGPH